MSEIHRVVSGVPTHKKCATCGYELPLLVFSRNRNAKDGYCHSCRGCERERLAVYKQTDRGADALRRGKVVPPSAGRDRHSRKFVVEVDRAVGVALRGIKAGGGDELWAILDILSPYAARAARKDLDAAVDALCGEGVD